MPSTSGSHWKVTVNCGCSGAMKSKPLSTIIFHTYAAGCSVSWNTIHVSSTWHPSSNFVSQSAPYFMPLYIYMFLSRSQHLKTTKEFPCLKKQRKLTWETMITLGNDGFHMTVTTYHAAVLLTTLRSCAVSNWKKSLDCCWPAFSVSNHRTPSSTGL